MKLPGEMLVKYKPGDKIGEGCHAKVHEVIDLTSGQCHAVKVLTARKPYQRAYADREVEALVLVTGHPNIVDVIETYKGRKHIYIVMERLPGNLLDYMIYPRTRQMVIDEIKIVSAVAHCHSKHVIHRDIKPCNLLISENNILKLADFGSAKVLERRAHRTTTVYVGSLYYTAPEVLMGSKSYSYPVDIWSVGSIFARMVNVRLFEDTVVGILVNDEYGWEEGDEEESADELEEIEGEEEGDEELDDDDESGEDDGDVSEEMSEGEIERIHKLDRENDLEQLRRIFSVFGTPKGDVLPGISKFVKQNVIPKYAAQKLQDLVPGLDTLGVDLLEKMLCLDPKRRIVASDALIHPFLTEL